MDKPADRRLYQDGKPQREDQAPQADSRRRSVRISSPAQTPRSKSAVIQPPSDVSKNRTAFTALQTTIKRAGGSRVSVMKLAFGSSKPGIRSIHVANRNDLSPDVPAYARHRADARRLSVDSVRRAPINESQESSLAEDEVAEAQCLTDSVDVDRVPPGEELQPISQQCVGVPKPKMTTPAPRDVGSGVAVQMPAGDENAVDDQAGRRMPAVSEQDGGSAVVNASMGGRLAACERMQLGRDLFHTAMRNWQLPWSAGTIVVKYEAICCKPNQIYFNGQQYSGLLHDGSSTLCHADSQIWSESNLIHATAANSIHLSLGASRVGTYELACWGRMLLWDEPAYCVKLYRSWIVPRGVRAISSQRNALVTLFPTRPALYASNLRYCSVPPAETPVVQQVVMLCDGLLHWLSGDAERRYLDLRFTEANSAASTYTYGDLDGNRMTRMLDVWTMSWQPARPATLMVLCVMQLMVQTGKLRCDMYMRWLQRTFPWMRDADIVRLNAPSDRMGPVILSRGGRIEAVRHLQSSGARMLFTVSNVIKLLLAKRTMAKWDLSTTRCVLGQMTAYALQSCESYRSLLPSMLAAAPFKWDAGTYLKLLLLAVCMPDATDVSELLLCCARRSCSMEDLRVGLLEAMMRLEECGSWRCGEMSFHDDLSNMPNHQEAAFFSRWSCLHLLFDCREEVMDCDKVVAARRGLMRRLLGYAWVRSRSNSTPGAAHASGCGTDMLEPQAVDARWILMAKQDTIPDSIGSAHATEILQSLVSHNDSYTVVMNDTDLTIVSGVSHLQVAVLLSRLAASSLSGVAFRSSRVPSLVNVYLHGSNLSACYHANSCVVRSICDMVNAVTKLPAHFASVSEYWTSMRSRLTLLGVGDVALGHVDTLFKCIP